MSLNRLFPPARADAGATERVARALLPAAALLTGLRTVEAHRVLGGFDAYSYWQGMRSFLEGGAPYDRATFVTPPSGAALLWPLAFLSAHQAFWLLSLASVAAFVASLILLSRLVDERRHYVVITGALLSVAVMSGTYQTVGFGNLNALVLLCWVLSLRAARHGRQTGMGLWLGLSLALKPVLAPVVLAYLMARAVRAVAISAAVPVALSVVPVAINHHLTGFATRAMPYLAHGLDDRFIRFDLSLRATGVELGVSSATVTAVRLAVVALGAVTTLAVWRLRLPEGAAGPATVVPLIETSSVLLVTTFLAGSFGWRYYTVFLLPLLATALVPGSLARHPSVWFSAVLWASPDSLGVLAVKQSLPHFDRVRPTLGLLLLLVSLPVVARRRRVGGRAPTRPRPWTQLTVARRRAATGEAVPSSSGIA